MSELNVKEKELLSIKGFVKIKGYYERRTDGLCLRLYENPLRYVIVFSIGELPLSETASKYSIFKAIREL